MGCGKSKHAVETATTVVKSSTNPDGTKQTTATTATKTVKVTGDSSVIQKEVETKSAFVEDDAKVTTKGDPDGLAKTDNMGPTLGENVEKPAQALKEDAGVKDSKPSDDVVPTSAFPADIVVKEHEKVKDLSLAEANGVNTDNEVHMLSKDDVDITEDVKEDEGKRESTLKTDTKAKTENAPPTEEEKKKESHIIMDNKTKIEFLTPTLSEDVVGPFEIAKGNEEVKDSKEEKVTTATSDENHVTSIDGSPKPTNLKVEEQKVVAQATESTKVETKKEEEDVEVTKEDIAKENISPAIETEKVPTANEANVAET